MNDAIGENCAQCRYFKFTDALNGTCHRFPPAFAGESSPRETHHWRFPAAIEPMPNDGPVLIQLEYRIDPDNEAAFIRAIHDVEPTRRRNGATSWRVFRDVGEAGRFVERFVIASWAEYVRLRLRMTFADREIQDRVAQLQREGVPVRVSRLIGVNPTEGLPADGEPAES